MPKTVAVAPFIKLNKINKFIIVSTVKTDRQSCMLNLIEYGSSYSHYVKTVGV